MASVTLQNLIDRARNRTDTADSTFITDDELTEYLNSSLAEMDDLLIAQSEDYKLTTVEATIASGATSFDLPDDFLKARGVDWQIGARWASLPEFQQPARNQRNDPWGATDSIYGYAVSRTYRIRDWQVDIQPESIAPGTYRLWYVPEFQALDGYADELPRYMSTQAWTEYAVVDAAIKIYAKQDLDPSVFMAQKGALQARILNAAKDRDAGPPKTIQDTRGRGRRGWGY